MTITDDKNSFYMYFYSFLKPYSKPLGRNCSLYSNNNIGPRNVSDVKINQGCLQSEPDRVAQSVGHLTRKSGVLGSIPGLATYFRFSFAFSRRAVVSYWRKYVHEVLVNRLGGLSLPRKSVVRLTDRPDMTLDVYRGRKTTMQQCLQSDWTSALFHD